MAVKAVLDEPTFSGLSEELKAEYKLDEKSGKYKLDVVASDGYELADVTGLKTALSQERASARAHLKTLDRFKDIEDPDAAREAIKKMAEFKDFKLEDKVEAAVKARQDELVRQHNTAMLSQANEVKTLMSSLEETLVISAATAAIAGEKGSVPLLLPHVKSSVKMRKTEQGKFVAEVVDHTGNPRVGDASGNPMTIAQLVSEMKSSDVYSRAFEPSGASGSGASNGGGVQDPVKAPPGKKFARTDRNGITSGASLEDIASGAAVVVRE